MDLNLLKEAWGSLRARQSIPCGTLQQVVMILPMSQPGLDERRWNVTIEGVNKTFDELTPEELILCHDHPVFNPKTLQRAAIASIYREKVGTAIPYPPAAPRTRMDDPHKILMGLKATWGKVQAARAAIAMADKDCIMDVHERRFLNAKLQHAEANWAASTQALGTLLEDYGNQTTN